MPKNLFILALCLNLTLTFGQEDSLSITHERLTWQDIQQTNVKLLDQKVSSASRSLKDLKELPFTIHVVTQEEIHQNGYITLADALKMLPGIKVSQPGSALQGELFMMRGLIGNGYTKILINGIPVKPYLVLGMPIGSQLPIQQADRIEVIYGPSAALYGADASAGVINIVMDESELPVYTNASLHLGSQGYSSLGILFGGKVGKGKDILRFKVYGSNTKMLDRRVFYDQDSLYNVAFYANQINQRVEGVVNSPNFLGTPNNILFNELPHNSRSVGVDLSYKIFSFSFLNMFRQDHSSLGLNPLAVAYANPNNTTGETITSMNLKAEKEFKNIKVQGIVGVLDYELDNRSTTTYISPTLSSPFDFAARLPVYQGIRDSLVRVYQDSLFNRSRFSSANSREYYLEGTLNWGLSNGFELNSGIRFQRGAGDQFYDFQRTPLQDGEEPRNIISDVDDPSYEEISAFVQLFFPYKKWNFLLGGQYLYRDNIGFSKQVSSLNPRIATLYKVNKRLSLRGNFSSAFRIPSPFLVANTFTIRFDTFDKVFTDSDPLEPERTFAFEGGLRWFPNAKLEVDLSAYYMETRDYVTYDIFTDLQPDVSSSFITIGYFNDEITNATLYGLQSMVWLKNLIPAIDLNVRLGLSYTRGEESYVVRDNVPVAVGNIDGLDRIRGQPDFMGQARISFSPIKNATVILDNVIMSSAYTRNLVLIEQDLGNGVGDDDLIQNGYHVLDITGNYQLSRNFRLYAKFHNVLNQRYAGIDANSMPDVLHYNPQSLFFVRLGLNYKLN
ncbi:MAG: TonB-dependent receptor [Bacteroidota bacterium]